MLAHLSSKTVTRTLPPSARTTVEVLLLLHYIRTAHLSVFDISNDLVGLTSGVRPPLPIAALSLRLLSRN